MPLPLVTTFFVIALGEGKCVCAYARDVGLERADMYRYSRHWHRARRPGLGLIRFEEDLKWGEQTPDLLD